MRMIKQLYPSQKLTPRNQEILTNYNTFKERYPYVDVMFFKSNNFYYEVFSKDVQTLDKYTDFILNINRSNQLAEDDGKPLYMTCVYAHDLDNILKSVVGRCQVIVIEDIDNPPDPPSESEERFDINKHLKSLLSYIWHDTSISLEMYKDMMRFALSDEEIPKELTDLAEESIYDWCAENNVNYDSVFDGRNLGDILRLKYRLEVEEI